MSTEEPTERAVLFVEVPKEDPAEQPVATRATEPDGAQAVSQEADPAAPEQEQPATAEERPAAGEERSGAARKRSRASRRAKAKRAPDPERRRRVLTVLAVIAVAIAMLYRPARDYYIAWRTGYTLGVRNEALAEENEQLNEDLDRLMTHEGIEDEARKRGYVMPGETSVKVEGLEEAYGTEESSGKASDITGEENLPWYIHVGDALFFYEPDQHGM